MKLWNRISHKKFRIWETPNLSTNLSTKAPIIYFGRRKKSIWINSLFLRHYESVHKCTSPPVEHLPHMDHPWVQSGTTACFWGSMSRSTRCTSPPVEHLPCEDRSCIQSGTTPRFLGSMSWSTSAPAHHSNTSHA